jgi:phospholipase A1
MLHWPHRPAALLALAVLGSTGASGQEEPPPERPAVAAEDERAAQSLIDRAWRFEESSSAYVLDVYNPNYVLFGRYSTDPNAGPFGPLLEPEDIDDVEAKFQISFKLRLWTTDDRRLGLWTGYTQQSQWQVYNKSASSPFRETDYLPEVFLSYRPGVELGGLDWNLLNLGYAHHSNGRTQPLSRSWDRIVATFGFEHDELGLLARAWYPYGYEDDNPDIVDYYGYGSLTGLYSWRDNSIALTVRGNVAEGKGAAELTWMSRPVLGALRVYVQGFTGYGESLIDYRWNQSTLGVGVERRAVAALSGVSADRTRSTRP